MFLVQNANILVRHSSQRCEVFGVTPAYSPNWEYWFEAWGCVCTHTLKKPSICGVFLFMILGRLHSVASNLQTSQLGGRKKLCALPTTKKKASKAFTAIYSCWKLLFFNVSGWRTPLSCSERCQKCQVSLLLPFIKSSPGTQQSRPSRSQHFQLWRAENRTMAQNSPLTWAESIAAFPGFAEEEVSVCENVALLRFWSATSQENLPPALTEALDTELVEWSSLNTVNICQNGNAEGRRELFSIRTRPLVETSGLRLKRKLKVTTSVGKKGKWEEAAEQKVAFPIFWYQL